MYFLNSAGGFELLQWRTASAQLSFQATDAPFVWEGGHQVTLAHMKDLLPVQGLDEISAGY